MAKKYLAYPAVRPFAAIFEIVLFLDNRVDSVNTLCA